MAEVAFAQEQPNPFNRVQFGTVGWLEHDRDIARNDEVGGGVPAGLVHNHDRVFVSGECCGELVEEHLHRVGVQLWQHQRECPPGLGLNSREQMNPGIALIAETRRPLAAREPAMANATLLTEPRLVLKPERQALIRIGRREAIQFVLKPPF